MEYLLSILNLCLPCFPNISLPSIKINRLNYKILKLLGEGSFSYVYLILQSSTQSLYALKKIRCLYGVQDETYKKSIMEVKNYKKFEKFKNPHLINMITYEILNEVDGSKNIYIVLPYFEMSLQDKLNIMVLNNEKMDEVEILKIFIGICRGVSVLHNYKSKVKSIESDLREGDEDEDYEGETEAFLNQNTDNDDEDGTNIENLNSEEDLSYNLNTLVKSVPYGHFDLKPSNVMLSPEGLPVVSDLGSCVPARYLIKTKQQSLNMTDYVQQHCSLPYRAPELFNIEINQQITEAIDIWSLGCILYSMMFSYSPFEKLELEQGGNLNLIIPRGKFEIPTNEYSESIIGLINDCLSVDPKERPTINQLLEKTLELARN